MAGCAFVDWCEGNALGIAQASFEMIAARAEVTALGAFMRQRQLAPDGYQRARIFVGTGQRNAIEQAMRVRVARFVEHLFDAAFLDHLAGIHHANAVAHFEDEAEIV